MSGILKNNTIIQLEKGHVVGLAKQNKRLAGKELPNDVKIQCHEVFA